MRYPHWQFFELLDDELHALSHFVDFNPDNYSTFSVELARLYLSICSEIDVVSKLLCARIAPAEAPKNINEYRVLITKQFPNFCSLRITMPSHDLEFQPWSAWESGRNPKWWGSYNDVKHERNKYYRDANLGNVLESAAGLLVMLVYLHQPELYSRTQPFQPNFKTMRIERKCAFVVMFTGFQYNLLDFGNSAKVRHPELFQGRGRKK